jgi:hypothetical protein
VHKLFIASQRSFMALRAPEARDGLAHFAWFKRMRVSTHTPPMACGQRAAERRDILQAVGRRQKAPPRAGLPPNHINADLAPSLTYRWSKSQRPRRAGDFA